jgi:hypothetical protein
MAGPTPGPPCQRLVSAPRSALGQRPANETKSIRDDEERGLSVGPLVISFSESEQALRQHTGALLSLPNAGAQDFPSSTALPAARSMAATAATTWMPGDASSTFS